MRSAIEIADGYLRGLVDGDLRATPFAPEVTYESPLCPRTAGKTSVTDQLTRLASTVEAVRIRRHVVEGPYVVILFDLETHHGTVPVSSCVRLSMGRILEIREYWDPRPLVNVLKEGPW